MPLPYQHKDQVANSFTQSWTLNTCVKCISNLNNESPAKQVFLLCELELRDQKSYGINYYFFLSIILLDFFIQKKYKSSIKHQLQLFLRVYNLKPNLRNNTSYKFGKFNYIFSISSFAFFFFFSFYLKTLHLA